MSVGAACVGCALFDDTSSRGAGAGLLLVCTQPHLRHTLESLGLVVTHGCWMLRELCVCVYLLLRSALSSVSCFAAAVP